MLRLSNRRNELGDLNFFVCFYYEDIINFTSGKFPKILIPRTILMNHFESPIDECKDLIWSEKNQLASAAWKLTCEDEKQVFKSSSDDLKSCQLQKHETQPGGKTFNFARLY
jgi:hypothetical protein